MGTQVAYIGLGSMGYQMAKHIAKKSKVVEAEPVILYNRSIEKATLLAAEVLAEKQCQVKVAKSIEEVAEKADIVFICLLNDAIVKDVVIKLLKSLKKGAIIIEQSTISPSVAYELAGQATEKGIHYFACPIMGPPAKAKSAELTILLAGPGGEHRQRVIEWTHNVIGPKVIELGEDVRESLKLKLCGNFLITSIVEMLAEGMTLGEKSGVGQDKVKELVDCVFPNSLLGIYAGRMLGNTYRDQVAFALSGAEKDARHILELGKEAGAALPTTQLFLGHLEEAKPEGDIDLSGIVGSLRKKAGLDFDLAEKK